MNFKSIATAFLFFAFLIEGKTQVISNNQAGFRVGISANFGSHINALGIEFSGYYQYEFLQANNGYLLRWNFEHLGARKSFFETRIALGVNGMFGPRESQPDFFINDYFFLDTRNYGLGYNYLWYLDRAESSQRSGALYARIQNFDIIMENDFLGGQGKDRFRTGLLHLQYRMNNVHFYSFIHLWTGETEGTPRRQDKPDLHPNGYKNISRQTHGKSSHGILGLGVRYLMPFGNSANLSVGYDDERIRHFFQNVLIHNKHFTPKAWRKPNAHYPMLNNAGMPAEEDEELRDSKFYLQGGLNYLGY
jgi:hypothetical protein